MVNASPFTLFTIPMYPSWHHETARLVIATFDINLDKVKHQPHNLKNL
jgi:hypothetical protein